MNQRSGQTSHGIGNTSSKETCVQILALILDAAPGIQSSELRFHTFWQPVIDLVLHFNSALAFQMKYDVSLLLLLFWPTHNIRSQPCSALFYRTGKNTRGNLYLLFFIFCPFTRSVLLCKALCFTFQIQHPNGWRNQVHNAQWPMLWCCKHIFGAQ